MSVAAATNALTTVANVKYVWGRPQADTAHDDRIQTLINLISSRIEGWCGRVFILTTYTDELYDGPGGYELFLKQYPITELSALEIDDTSVDLTEFLAGDSDDIFLYGKEGYVRYEPGFPPGNQNIKLTYKAGYAAADIPQGLAMACVEWAIILLEGRMKDAKVDQRDVILAVPDAIAMALQPFKRMDI